MDRRDMLIKVDYDTETVEFEHAPDKGISSSGVLSFFTIGTICKGDGWNTPDVIDQDFNGFEFDEIQAFDEDGNELETVPNEYKDSIINMIIREL